MTTISRSEFESEIKEAEDIVSKVTGPPKTKGYDVLPFKKGGPTKMKGVVYIDDGISKIADEVWEKKDISLLKTMIITFRPILISFSDRYALDSVYSVAVSSLSSGDFEAAITVFELIYDARYIVISTKGNNWTLQFMNFSKRIEKEKEIRQRRSGQTGQSGQSGQIVQFGQTFTREQIAEEGRQLELFKKQQDIEKKKQQEIKKKKQEQAKKKSSIIEEEEELKRKKKKGEIPSPKPLGIGNIEKLPIDDVIDIDSFRSLIRETILRELRYASEGQIDELPCLVALYETLNIKTKKIKTLQKIMSGFFPKGLSENISMVKKEEYEVKIHEEIYNQQYRHDNFHYYGELKQLTLTGHIKHLIRGLAALYLSGCAPSELKEMLQNVYNLAPPIFSNLDNDRITSAFLSLIKITILYSFQAEETKLSKVPNIEIETMVTHSIFQMTLIIRYLTLAVKEGYMDDINNENLFPEPLAFLDDLLLGLLYMAGEVYKGVGFLINIMHVIECRIDLIHRSWNQKYDLPLKRKYPDLALIIYHEISGVILLNRKTKIKGSMNAYIDPLEKNYPDLHSELKIDRNSITNSVIEINLNKEDEKIDEMDSLLSKTRDFIEHVMLHYCIESKGVRTISGKIDKLFNILESVFDGVTLNYFVFSLVSPFEESVKGKGAFNIFLHLAYLAEDDPVDWDLYIKQIMTRLAFISDMKYLKIFTEKRYKYPATFLIFLSYSLVDKKILEVMPEFYKTELAKWDQTEIDKEIGLFDKTKVEEYFLEDFVKTLGVKLTDKFEKRIEDAREKNKEKKRDEINNVLGDLDTEFEDLIYESGLKLVGFAFTAYDAKLTLTPSIDSIAKKDEVMKMYLKQHNIFVKNIIPTLKTNFTDIVNKNVDSEYATFVVASKKTLDAAFDVTIKKIYADWLTQYNILETSLPDFLVSHNDMLTAHIHAEKAKVLKIFNDTIIKGEKMAKDLIEAFLPSSGKMTNNNISESPTFTGLSDTNAKTEGNTTFASSKEINEPYDNKGNNSNTKMSENEATNLIGNNILKTNSTIAEAKDKISLEKIINVATSSLDKKEPSPSPSSSPNKTIEDNASVKENSIVVDWNENMELAFSALKSGDENSIREHLQTISNIATKGLEKQDTHFMGTMIGDLSKLSKQARAKKATIPRDVIRIENLHAKVREKYSDIMDQSKPQIIKTARKQEEEIFEWE